MKFPDFVPKAVQKHITVYLEGEPPEKFGWVMAQKSSAKELSGIRKELRSASASKRAILKRKEIEVAQYSGMEASTVKCITRVGTSFQMRECYDLLRKESFDDEQLKRFIHVAWAAHLDYTKYRERLKKAAKLTKAIAKSADRLTNLIRQLLDTGIPNSPDEFNSIHALLSKTEHADRDPGERNYAQHGYWRTIRHHILSDRNQDGDGTKPVVNVKASKIGAAIIRRPLNNKAHKKKAPPNLYYVWQQAPSVPDLTESIARSARHFKPSQNGIIGAAIASRQRSRAQNKEYLRAFGALLEKNPCRIELTSAVIKAISIVATVAVNNSNFVVTYDDVVKAIGGPVETQL
jgi:hypothetical protein